MALIIENGSIVANANSYVTIDEIKAFVGSIPLPASTDAEIERAAVSAAHYLDGKYRARWKGARVQPVTQCMEWPRYGIEVGAVAPALGGIYLNGAVFNQFVPSTSIPQRIKSAQIELTLRAVSAPLSADAIDGKKREKLDTLETEYATGSAPIEVYRVVDYFISDYIRPAGGANVNRG